MTFYFIYTYFTAVYSSFTCSNYTLCSSTNYNVRRVLGETWSFLQLLLAPKSVESTPSGDGATPAQGCHFSFTARYTRDVFMPQEIQRSVFSKRADLLSSLPELGKMYVNQTMGFFFLLFQVYPKISALWMNQTEMTQWEAVCTTDWPEKWIQGRSFWIRRIAPRPSNSNKDGCNF